MPRECVQLRRTPPGLTQRDNAIHLRVVRGPLDRSGRGRDVSSEGRRLPDGPLEGHPAQGPSTGPLRPQGGVGSNDAGSGRRKISQKRSSALGYREGSHLASEGTRRHSLPFLRNITPSGRRAQERPCSGPSASRGLSAASAGTPPRGEGQRPHHSVTPGRGLRSRWRDAPSPAPAADSKIRSYVVPLSD